VSMPDLSKMSDDYLGNNALVIRDKSDVAAAYVPPVYYGPIAGQTASTLRRGESFIDVLGVYGYGITQNLSVATRMAELLKLSPNFGIKYSLVDNSSFTISPYFALLYNTRNQTFNMAVTLYVDRPAGRKLVSHTSIRWGYDSDPNNRGNPISSSEIKTGYAYIFDNWNRLVIGPTYNFDIEKVGGYVAYMIPYEHLHIVMGLSSIDFSNFKLAQNGYIPFVLAFWRF